MVLKPAKIFQDRFPRPWPTPQNGIVPGAAGFLCAERADYHHETNGDRIDVDRCH